MNCRLFMALSSVDFQPSRSTPMSIISHVAAKGIVIVEIIASFGYVFSMLELLEFDEEPARRACGFRTLRLFP